MSCFKKMRSSRLDSIVFVTNAEAVSLPFSSAMVDRSRLTHFSAIDVRKPILGYYYLDMAGFFLKKFLPRTVFSD